MKILLIGIIAFVIFFVSASSYGEIPSSIKNNAEQMLNRNFEHSGIVSVIEDIARENFFTKVIHENHQFHILPELGKIIFIKISGQMEDYGKTGSVLITIIKPDKSSEIIHASLLETGKYLTYFPIDHSSQKGTYTVLAKFGNQNMSSYFHISPSKINTDVPSWFEIPFQWWIEQKISDNEFVNSMQFLIDSQIATIVLRDESVAPGFHVSVKGEQMVRRGTTHTIISHVTDDINPVEGAKITLRIEDYGEGVVREFEGFTNENGDFIFSWEIPKSFDDLETLLAYISVTHGEFSTTSIFKFQVYCLPGESQCRIDGN